VNARLLLAVCVVSAFASSLRAQIPEEISESFGRSGWFEPKSSYSSPTTGYRHPGWYSPRGALARKEESRRIGWFAPLATTSGDSSSGVTRPGWYLPDRLLSEHAVSQTSKSAHSLIEGFTLAEARNESKAKVAFTRGQGEGLDTIVEDDVRVMRKRSMTLGRISQKSSFSSSRPRLGRSVQVDRRAGAQDKPGITASRYAPVQRAH